MNKGIYIIVALFCLTACGPKPEITKSLVYSTLNDVIKNDSVFTAFICARFYKAEIPDSIITRYFNNDKEFIRQQLLTSETHFVDSGKVFYYSGRNKRYQQGFVDANCSNKNDCSLAWPVYSRDLHTVVLSFSMFDGGFSAVYKWKNGQWLLADKYESWIY